MNIRMLLAIMLLCAGLACDKVVKEADVPAPIGDAPAALAHAPQQ